MATLLQLIDKLYNVGKFDWTPLTEQERDAVYKRFGYWQAKTEAAVLASTDPVVLKQIIYKEWRTMELPMDTMFLIYQRLLELELTDENVRDFARYLDLYGYDWAEEIKDMLGFLEAGQMDEVLRVTRRVDYWKWGEEGREFATRYHHLNHDEEAIRTDPEFETLSQYSQGSVRLLRFYYNEQDELVPRSQAIKYRSYEFRENCTLLHMETMSIK